MSRSLKLFVIGSVLLNLLLLGMVCGQVGRRLMPAVDQRLTVEEITAALPPDKRALFQEKLTATQASVDPIRKTIDLVRRESLCILATDPFDKIAYEDKINQLHRLHGEWMQKIVEATTETGSKFTPKERIAFMDLLRPPLAPLPDNPCATPTRAYLTLKNS